MVHRYEVDHKPTGSVTTLPPTERRTWSVYQRDFFQAIVTTRANLALSAVPGSGKTTSLVEGLRLIPYGKSILFVAFAKAIVEELRSRLPKTVDCRTMHSIGFKAIWDHFPGEKVLKEKKQVGFIEPLFAQEKIPLRLKWQTVYQLDRILSLARATMVAPEPEALAQVITDHALDELEEERYLEYGALALKKFYQYNRDQDRYNVTVDFQDLIEMPVKQPRIRLPQYDYVGIDEIQDLSNLDLLFISRLVKPGGRVIAVGDKHQSIYQFRGANPNSFDQFTEKFQCTVLPLSISYRCAKAVVANARTIYPTIETFEGNSQGEVRLGGVTEIREGDLVLCRNNRPLVDLFFRLLLAGKKAHLVGKEGVYALLKLLAHCDPDDDRLTALDKLDAVQARLEDSLRAKGITHPDKHPKAVNLTEQVTTIAIIFQRYPTVRQVEEWIEATFAEDEHGKVRPGVRLMSIHRAKGLESHTVFVIDRYEGKRLVPNQFAVTPDQRRAERNLSFVSRTRSKQRLILLHL